MSPEKQRIAIAKACGWHHEKGGWKNIYLWVANAKDIPDYLNDLNAMHEAEKNLHHQGFRRFKIYVWLLNQVTSNKLHLWEPNEYGMCDNWQMSLWDCGLAAHATAAQRAEAFLRAMNLWEESP